MCFNYNKQKFSHHGDIGDCSIPARVSIVAALAPIAAEDFCDRSCLRTSGTRSIE